MRRMVWTVAALLIALPTGARGQQVFFDDFEHGLEGWDVYGTEGVAVIASGDPQHGHVLLLDPNGDVHALIRGSSEWGSVRIEGEVRFPRAEDNYLGLIYNLQRRDARLDFGNVYIKGNGSYLQVNPHRDYNVSRTLYPEFHVSLDEPDEVRIGDWQPFAVEVMGSVVHVYFNDLSEPKLTFRFLELTEGAVGLQPRSVGGDVWVDNIRVTQIADFSYGGPEVPVLAYDAAELLTNWEVLGPLPSTMDEVAQDLGGSHAWRTFATDGRGAVVTGTVVDNHGANSVAYFRTSVHADAASQALLHLSTIDDLSMWVNGRFHWFLDRRGSAWHDFARNPEHEGQRIPVDLKAGTNQIVIRVRGGVYATGGFYAAVERP